MYVFEVIKKLPQKCQEDLEKLRNKKKMSMQRTDFIAEQTFYQTGGQIFGYLDCLISLGLVEEKCRFALIQYYFSTEEHPDSVVAEILD